MTDVFLSPQAGANSPENANQMLENLPCAVLEIDTKGRIFYANIKARTLLNIADLSPGWFSIQQYIPPTDQAYFNASIHRVKEDSPAHFTVQFNGQNLSHYIELGALKNNRIQLTLTPQESQQANQLNQQIKVATESAGIGVWIYDFQSGSLSWDEQMHRLYDVEAHKYQGTYEHWTRFLHPDDLEQTEAIFKNSIQSQTTFDTNFRILTPLGAEKVLKAYGHIQFDEQHNPVSVVGVNYDLTAITHAQEQLEISLKENQFLAKVAQETDNGVFITDSELNIQWINQSFTHLTGYSLDEVFGLKPCDTLFGEETDPKQIARLKTLPHSRESFVSEVVFYHKSGIKFWARMSLQPLLEFEQLKGFMAILLDINQEKLAVSSLRNISNMQQAILDSANLSIVSTDISGTIKTFNKGAQDALGYSESETIDKMTPMAFHEPSEIRARAKKLSIELGRQVEPNFNVFTFKATVGLVGEREWTFIRKDGTKFPMMLSVSPLYSSEGELEGFLTVGRNLEELKRYEQEKLRTQRLLEATEKMAKVGGWEYEIATKTLFWSQEVFRIHDLPVNSEINVEKAIEYYAPEARPIVQQAMQRAIEKGLHWDLKLPFITAKGRKIWVRAYGYPVEIDGVTKQLKGAFQDITEMKEAEEQAKAASRAKSEFLANMSHELRTPINGVLGMNELLLKTPLSQAQQHYAKLAQTSGQSLLHLINDILDFSKIEAGKLEIENIDFNLHDLLTSITDTFALKAKEKSLELISTVAADIPRYVKADPIRLRQIINNLLSNAIKFTAQGQINFTVTQSAERKLHFQVKDTGVGIATSKIEHLFDKFTQADASTTRKYGGTGLGLAISKQLCEMMGGNIGIRSACKQGAEFWFDIRFNAASTLTTEKLANNSTVLLIDPAPERLKEYSHLLQRHGFTVIHGQDAREGLKHLRQKTRDVSLLLLQHDLPGMNGEQFIHVLRNESSLGSLPIVLLSQNSDFVPSDFLQQQVGFFLSQPLNKHVISEQIMPLLMGNMSQPLSTNVHHQPVFNKNDRHLLLVEDNFINQQVAQEILRNLGYQVSVVDNGQQAIDFLHQTSQKIDLILMDCQMPIMDGYEATHHIRHSQSSDINSQIPIVALTANALEGDKKKCLAAGMSGYLPKPIIAEDLDNEICRWLMND